MRKAWVAAGVAWLLAFPFALPAQAQRTDDERDAEIERLRQTVDRLVRRIEVLEAERSVSAASTPASPVPGSSQAMPPSAGAGVAVTAAMPPAAEPPPRPQAMADAAPSSAPPEPVPMPVPEQSPLPAHPGRLAGREPADVPLDGLADEEELPATEGSDVMDSFQEDGVLQAGSDRPGVVVDDLGELIGGKVRLVHNCAP